MDKSLSPDRRADLVLAEMTLDEKIMLVHGTGGFEASGPRSNGGAGVIEGIPRLGLPDLQLADSAVGVRAAADRAGGIPPYCRRRLARRRPGIPRWPGRMGT